MANNLLKIDADIERALTDFIREKLNANSYDVFFSLGFWVNTMDRNSEAIQMIESPDIKYLKEDKRFVPMTIEGYDGRITALEGLFNAEYMVPLTFQINIDDPEFLNTVIDALNEFKNSLRGQVFRIPVETETGTEMFTAVTATDNISPQGNLDTMMGDVYAYATLSISFDISKDLSYGNQVHIFLGEYDATETNPQQRIKKLVRAYPINPSIERTNNTESFQNYGANEVVNLVKDSEYVFGTSLFVKEDDLHYSLLEDIVKKNTLNRPYYLRMEFKRYNGTELDNAFVFEDIVTIVSGTASFTIGENIFMEVGLAKYLITEELPIFIPPDSENLLSPSLVSENYSFTGQFIQGSGIFGQFEVKNEDVQPADLRVCILGTCKTETNISGGDSALFEFDQMPHSESVEISMQAISTSTEIDNSPISLDEINVIPITISVDTNETKFIEWEIVNQNPGVIQFKIKNPYPYPITTFVNFQGVLSSPFLVNPFTTPQQQSTYTYSNVNLVVGTPLNYNFQFRTLPVYGNVLVVNSPNIEYFLSEIDSFNISPFSVKVDITKSDNQTYTDSQPLSFSTKVDITKFEQQGETYTDSQSSVLSTKVDITKFETPPPLDEQTYSDSQSSAFSTKVDITKFEQQGETYTDSQSSSFSTKVDITKFEQQPPPPEQTYTQSQSSAFSAKVDIIKI